MTLGFSSGTPRTVVALLRAGLWVIVAGAAMWPAMGATQTDPSTLSADQQQYLVETLTRGNEAFNDGRYDDALTAYEAGLRVAEFPELHYRRALCLEKLGRLRDAIAAYESFLRIEPDAPDRGRIEAEIGRMQATLDKRERSTLSVHTEPAGATVHLGNAQGRVLGVTPLESVLPAGPHTLYIARDGYEPRSAQVVAKGGEGVTVQLTLSRPAGPQIVPQVVPTVVSTPLDTAPWGWGAAVTGGALLATSGVFWVLADSGYQDANDYSRADPAHSRRELVGIQDDAAALETGFWITASVGTALLATGGVLLWIDEGETAWISPGPGSVTLMGRF